MLIIINWIISLFYPQKSKKGILAEKIEILNKMMSQHRDPFSYVFVTMVCDMNAPGNVFDEIWAFSREFCKSEKISLLNSTVFVNVIFTNLVHRYQYDTVYQDMLWRKIPHEMCLSNDWVAASKDDYWVTSLEYNEVDPLGSIW